MNTRIAPSPTGSFHLGTARTAYLNWLAAKSTGGKFILRIDDTDASRNIDGAEDNIIESLEWLGLTPDKTFKQSQKFKYCQMYANLAADSDNPYVVRENGAIILKSNDIDDKWHDEILGDIIVSEDDKRIASNIVLLRSDGTPTYMFSSVMNDLELMTDIIIRGTDHISNTLRQIVIFRFFTYWDDTPRGFYPKFAHVGLLRQDGKKLSKRIGSKDVLWYRDQGYSPDAILSWLLRHGWSHSDPNYNKPISKSEALDMFWKGHMNAKDSNLDFNKLNWIQKKLIAE